MYNWNDVEVEQKIAQERYQSIVEGRRVARARQRAKTGDVTVSPSARLLGFFGDLLVSWGCALQERRGPDGTAAVCRSGAAG